MGFVGRFDESRKGMSVLLDALRLIAPTGPTCSCWWPAAVTRKTCGSAGAELRGPVVLGRVSEADKARCSSLDIYCAPNRRGESSDHPHRGDERRDPGGGQRSRCVPAGAGQRHRRGPDPGAMPAALAARCPGCSTTRAVGRAVRAGVGGWWPPTTGTSLARRILAVYETVAAARGR